MNVKRIFLSMSLASMAIVAPLSSMEQESRQKQWLMIDTIGVSENDVTTALEKATEKKWQEWLTAYTNLSTAKRLSKKSVIDKAAKSLANIEQDVRNSIAEMREQAQPVAQEEQVKSTWGQSFWNVLSWTATSARNTINSGIKRIVSDESEGQHDDAGVVEIIKSNEKDSDIPVVVNQELTSEEDSDKWLPYLTKSPICEELREARHSRLAEVDEKNESGVSELSEEESDVSELSEEEVIKEEVIKKESDESGVSEAPNNGAIVLYKDSSKIIGKPVVFDLSMALKIAKTMESQPEKLFSKIMMRQWQQANPGIMPKSDLLTLGKLIDQAKKVNNENITVIDEDGNISITDANGKVIASVSDEFDSEESEEDPSKSEEEIIEPALPEGGVKIEINNPKGPVGPEVIEPKPEVPVDPQGKPEVVEAANNSFWSLNSKPLLFGCAAICGASAFCWKLYKNSSYYQCGLLKKWQTQVAGAIAGVISGTQVSQVQIPEIKLSQLTRLTAAEREQLAQAHNSLVMAFDKAHKTVAAQTAVPVRNGQAASAVKELQATHAQWDALMNDCKNTVKKASIPLW